METLTYAIAIGAFLAGLVLGAYALLWDGVCGGGRRARCPRCRYSMEGIAVPGACPECGRRIASLHEMFWWRVRWRVLAAGLLIAAAGPPAAVGVSIKPRWLPTRLLITLCRMPEQSDPIGEELMRRHDRGELSPEHYRLLSRGAEARLLKASAYSDPFAWVAAVDREHTWILENPDSAERLGLIGRLLGREESVDGLILARGELRRRKQERLPSEWSGAIERMVQQGNGRVVLALLEEGGCLCAAPPPVVSQLVDWFIEAPPGHRSGRPGERGSPLPGARKTPVLSIRMIAQDCPELLDPCLPRLAAAIEGRRLEGPAVFELVESMGGRALPIAESVLAAAADENFQYATEAARAYEAIARGR